MCPEKRKSAKFVESTNLSNRGKVNTTSGCLPVAINPSIV